jgi:hypothetical protein
MITPYRLFMSEGIPLAISRSLDDCKDGQLVRHF